MVQPPLVPPECFVPMPQGSAHYVAVMKNKIGELEALRHASPQVWARLTPLIELIGRKKPPEAYNSETVKTWLRRVADAVGQHPIFLDVIRLKPSHPALTKDGTLPVLSVIYEAARKHGLAYVPVVRPGVPPADLRLVRRAVLCEGRGVAIRYPLLEIAMREGQTAGIVVKQILTDVEVEITGSDLLIDLRYLGPELDVRAGDLAPSVKELVAIGDWRSVAILGTSMPSSLGGVISEWTVGELPRREWELWSALKRNLPEPIPTFGDYVVQNPRVPEDETGGGPSMRANIRYTSERATLIARGLGPVIVEGKEQYRDLCQMLVQRPEFSGRDYSWGDEQIVDCADGLLEPGSYNAWRGAGSSHHLQLITDSLMV